MPGVQSHAPFGGNLAWLLDCPISLSTYRKNPIVGVSFAPPPNSERCERYPSKIKTKGEEEWNVKTKSCGKK